MEELNQGIKADPSDFAAGGFNIHLAGAHMKAVRSAFSRGVRGVGEAVERGRLSGGQVICAEHASDVVCRWRLGGNVLLAVLTEEAGNFRPDCILRRPKDDRWPVVFRGACEQFGSKPLRKLIEYCATAQASDLAGQPTVPTYAQPPQFGRKRAESKRGEVRQRVGRFERKSSGAKKGVVNDGVHESERFLDQGKLGDLRQVVDPLIDAETDHSPGSGRG
jgi:hypothetical protein